MKFSLRKYRADIFPSFLQDRYTVIQPEYQGSMIIKIMFLFLIK